MTRSKHARRRARRPYSSADEPYGFGGARRDPFGRVRRAPERPTSAWRRMFERAAAAVTRRGEAAAPGAPLPFRT